MSGAVSIEAVFQPELLSCCQVPTSVGLLWAGSWCSLRDEQMVASVMTQSCTAKKMI